MGTYRPVGTNLVLVQRVTANDLPSMKAEQAKRVTAWGSGAAQGPLVGVQRPQKL